jgi:NTE family protein
MGKRSLCVSGGGSLGAWAIGLSQQLVESGNKYDVYVGSSTGSLVSALIAKGNFDLAKEAYTNITQKDIFSVNPFRKNGKIDYFSSIYNMVIRNQSTFGDSSNLRKTISRFFTEEDFDTLKKTNKDLVVCVSNLTTQLPEYKSIKKLNYIDFCDFMHASASAAPFMSLIEKNGFKYMDGGVFNHVPIQQAIDLGCDVIDVIVLRTEKDEVSKEHIKSPFDLIVRIMDSMLKENALIAKNKDVEINIYYLPKLLTNNILIFNKEKMSRWWSMGYSYGKDPKTIIIEK